MLASPDDVQESPEHIPARPPAGERSTLLSDPRYHTPCIQNGVQAQKRRMFSFPLTSAFRCSKHNQEVSSTGPNGPHTDHGHGGQAVDVKISGADALRLVEIAKKYSMTGIGVKQNGPAGKRFIHLDNLGSDCTKLTGGPRPWLWSYA